MRSCSNNLLWPIIFTPKAIGFLAARSILDNIINRFDQFVGQQTLQTPGDSWPTTVRGSWPMPGTIWVSRLHYPTPYTTYTILRCLWAFLGCSWWFLIIQTLQAVLWASSFSFCFFHLAFCSVLYSFLSLQSRTQVKKAPSLHMKHVSALDSCYTSPCLMHMP